MILQGDARHIPLADETVQMIVTSPPYSSARPEYAEWQSHEAYLADMSLAWKECFRVLCDGGRIAVNVVHGYGRPGSDRHGYFPLGHRVADQLEATGFRLRGVIIWNKTHHVLASGVAQTAWGSWKSASNPSLRDQHELILVAHKGQAGRGPGPDSIDTDTFLKATSSVWVIPPAPHGWHPAPYPPEIPRRLIELYSFVGDVILDPFSGSGTTERVAITLGRRGIGIELDWDYARRSIDALPQGRLALDLERSA